MTPHAASVMPTQPAQTRLPTPRQLAGLGTVLCLYRNGPGGELAGWSRAVRAEACATLDSDGMHECVAFHDAAGECCWKLYLLPDSEFLAWERQSAALPVQSVQDAPNAGVGERLLRRLGGWVRGGHWQGSVLRLHALCVAPGMPSHAVLAASLASVSPLGAAAARRIARSQGADADALTDECCCQRAARVAALAAAGTAHDDAPYPLIRLNPNTHD